MDTHVAIIALCLAVVLSYVFNVVSNYTRIPSVVLLISAGALLKYSNIMGEVNEGFLNSVLEMLGVMGLIMIVLEGSLELKINRQKRSLILRSFLTAFIVLVLSAGIIAWILNYFFQMNFRESVVYAIPLGVVSSAIAIPSVEKLIEAKREFIIYESTFSDIIGVVAFNYFIQDDAGTSTSVLNFSWRLLAIFVLSLLSTILVTFVLHYIKAKTKFFLTLAILALLYSSAKILHLPSLIMILLFGLCLNNPGIFEKLKISSWIHSERITDLSRDMRMITQESAFLIRTFFFLLFGYTLDLPSLIEPEVVKVGSLILGFILIVRFIWFRLVNKQNLFPEIFIAPRGLITVVLFFSIPATLHSPHFNNGILYFVIVGSALLMMLALMFSKGGKGQSPPDL